MSTPSTAMTLIPLENVKGAESPAFREVIAYLNGVADTVSAHSGYERPLSLIPYARISSRAPSGMPGRVRVTLRFGEVPFDRASVWPQVAVGLPAEPKRGGSRTLDLEIEGTSTCSLAPVFRRYTLPYDAPSASLAPPFSPIPLEFDEASEVSEIRLRPCALPREWYQLTGSEGSGAG